MVTKYVLLLFLSVACTEQVVHLSPLQTQELLQQKEKLNLFVLNVHTPYEGELEKTDAFIEDWQNIAAHTDKLPTNKNQPLLVYCRSGRMSTAAVEQLQKLGYKKIYHLDGGMRAWEQAGLTLTK